MTATTPALSPVLLALAAAFLFGVSSVTAKRGLAFVQAHVGSLLSIGTTVVVYLLLSPWWMRTEDWFTPGFWIFVLNGLIHPMLSMYLALEAAARTGATVAATFSSTAPLFAAMTAMLFLGETLSLPVALGTLATVAGIATLSWHGGATRVVRTALLFATGAAVIRGINHTVGKWGLELLPNVFMAGFVSFSVSFLGSATLYCLRRDPRAARLPAQGIVLFIITGCLIAAAILCMYGALAVGSVVVVSPIVAAYPLFTLLTVVAVRQEVLTRRLVAGVLVVVAGVCAISLGATA